MWCPTKTFTQEARMSGLRFLISDTSYCRNWNSNMLTSRNIAIPIQNETQQQIIHCWKQPSSFLLWSDSSSISLFCLLSWGSCDLSMMLKSLPDPLFRAVTSVFDFSLSNQGSAVFLAPHPLILSNPITFANPTILANPLWCSGSPGLPARSDN